MFTALCVLCTTGVSGRNSQYIWFRPRLHVNQLGRSIFAFGPWFPQLKTDWFLAPHPLLAPAFCELLGTHIKEPQAVGKMGNTEPGTEPGMSVLFMIGIMSNI